MAKGTHCQPDALTLQLHRYVWQPARYAHPRWLGLIGFQRYDPWCYGECPVLDRALNHALRQRLGIVCLPGRLNKRQRRLVSLAHELPKYVLALGLLTLACSDYFLLPQYRTVLRRWLDDDLLWRLFGLCNNTSSALFSPEGVIAIANDIGLAMLYRAARNEPVLQALLVLLPPPTKALYPRVSSAIMNLLERMLCRCIDFH